MSCSIIIIVIIIIIVVVIIIIIIIIPYKFLLHPLLSAEADLLLFNSVTINRVIDYFASKKLPRVIVGGQPH